MQTNFSTDNNHIAARLQCSPQEVGAELDTTIIKKAIPPDQTSMPTQILLPRRKSIGQLSNLFNQTTQALRIIAPNKNQHPSDAHTRNDE